jgi:hypothetical protein
MDEPRRLLGDTDDAMERALLEAGREDRASPEARQRTLAALGLSAATAGAGASAAAKPWWSAAWAKALGLAALGLGAGAIAWGVGRTSESSTPVPANPAPAITAPAAAAAEPAAPPATPAAALAAPTAEPTTAPASTARAQRVPGATVARAPSTTPSPATAAPPSGNLAEEIATIDRARRALYDHDAHGALRALDEHDRRFPQGALGPEAQVLRVEALLAAGDRPGAEALGGRLLAASPSGPQAERVRALLRR